METDEGKLTRASGTHRHDGDQEERVTFPDQGLMGQEAGSFPKLAGEMRKREARLAQRRVGFPLVDPSSNCRQRWLRTHPWVFQKQFLKLGDWVLLELSGPPRAQIQGQVGLA